MSSELTYADWFVEHTGNPDYKHIIENLKDTLEINLETYYMRVSYKVSVVTKPKPKDQIMLTPREMRISPSQDL